MRRRLWVPLAALTMCLAVTSGPALGSGHAKRHALTPRSGGAHTGFTLSYVSWGADAASGDQLYLYGPRGTRCHGLLVQEPTGYSTGTQTIRFQFRREASDEHAGVFWLRPATTTRQGKFRNLHEWCRGYYHGHVTNDIEDESGPNVVVSRFFFVVR